MAITDIVKNNSYFFLQGFLERPASSIPKGAQWAITFETTEKSLYQAIFPAIKLAYEYEPGGLSEWNTESAAKAVLNKDYQKTRGCLFCQGISLPGEKTNPITQGIQSNAFIRTYVGAGREDFPLMRMSFIDTHVSFADSFLRGWALATSNFGMIARSKTDQRNYRTDLFCHKFGITPKGPVILQTMKFKDVCCVSVSEEEYNYNSPNGPVLREAQFIYNSYSIDTVTGNSADIINNTRPSIMLNDTSERVA